MPPTMPTTAIDTAIGMPTSIIAEHREEGE